MKINLLFLFLMITSIFSAQTAEQILKKLNLPLPELFYHSSATDKTLIKGIFSN